MRSVVAAIASVLVGAAALSAQAPERNTDPPPAAAPPSCADTADVVRRAVAYVARYGEALGSVIAAEDYRQDVLGEFELNPFIPPPITIVGGIQVQPAAPMSKRPRVTSRLRSSFLFIQIPDGPGWVGFRDVHEANGRRVTADVSTQPPLERPDESGLERWRRLSEQSARYNLGTITRTLNVPTFALLVLHAGNQPRFAFTSGGERRVAGGAACDLRFEEQDRPTIIRSAVGADLAASGTFWIDPVSGRVLQSELMAGSTKTGVASKVSVRYERDRRLELWVPREMREEYVAASGERAQCVARYSDYRRAEVTIKIR
ncbi:MAG: hypothetical protein OEW19_12535 [Acidobacteriota bacterium]|nr:hypothetical protein [Acidobacteriota bacterium]